MLDAVIASVFNALSKRPVNSSFFTVVTGFFPAISVSFTPGIRGVLMSGSTVTSAGSGASTTSTPSSTRLSARSTPPSRESFWTKQTQGMPRSSASLGPTCWA